MNGDNSPSGGSSASLRSTLRISALVVTLSLIAVIAGIGLVALLGGRGDDVTWERWSSVGEAFGVVNSLVSVFAVAVVLVTWSTQYRFLRDQKAEFAQQRKIQEDRADLELRKMHVDLIRMALADNSLAAVWPRIAGVDPVTESQHMYANLLLQHIWLEHSAGRSSRDQMLSNVRYLFASPAVRAFWRSTENSRHSIYSDHSEQAEFVAVMDEVWRQCEAVLACSDRQPEREDPTGLWFDEGGVPSSPTIPRRPAAESTSEPWPPPA
jgi:hypothetical protein